MGRPLRVVVSFGGGGEETPAERLFWRWGCVLAVVGFFGFCLFHYLQPKPVEVRPPDPVYRNDGPPKSLEDAIKNGGPPPKVGLDPPSIPLR